MRELVWDVIVVVVTLGGISFLIADILWICG